MQNSASLRHPLPIGRRLGRPEVFQVRLQYGEVFTLPGDHCGAQIASIESVLWVTQDNDRDDHVLQPGELFRITLPGRVVAEGMRKA